MKNPKFKKGDRCMFVYFVGIKKPTLEILDDNMVIADNDPEWINGDWWYNIVDKANRTDEKYLRIYNSNKIF